MMGALIPLWIIGGPFIALLILSFSFGKTSAMSGGRGLRSAEDSVVANKVITPHRATPY